MNQSEFNQLVHDVCEVTVTDPAIALVDLGVDSLAYLNLVLAVEERYGFEIDPDLLSDPALASPAGLWSFAEAHARTSA
jgi:acyl carrier protein